MLLLLLFSTSCVCILAQENSITMLKRQNQMECASPNNKFSAWQLWRRIIGKHKRDMSCFDFYAFNDSSIYFRWNPPFSLTGIIELYRIRYEASSVPEKLVVFEPTPCTVWPWMHCTSIQNLEVSKSYQFEISTKYNDSSNWKIQASTPSLKRQTSRPDPPKILRNYWDKHYNLTIEWQYPNKTNGILKSFQIELNGATYMVPVEPPHLNYSFSIIYITRIDIDVIDVSILCENMDSQVSRSSIIRNIDLPPRTPELRQRPALLQIFKKSVQIWIPQLKKITGNGFSYLHIIVTKIASEGDPKVHPNQTKFISQVIDLEPNMIAWLATEYRFYGNASVNLTIGDKSTMFSNVTEQEIANWDLPQAVNLNIFIVVSNHRKEFIRFSSYHIEIRLPKAISPYIYLSFLVLIIAMSLCVYVVRKKRIRFTRF